MLQIFMAFMCLVLWSETYASMKVIIDVIYILEINHILNKN